MISTSRKARTENVVWIFGFTILVKAGIVLVGIFLWETPYVDRILGDIRTWFTFWEACHNGAIPYVDITKEYAVGTGLLYWAMAPVMSLADGDEKVIFVLHAVLTSVMDATNAAILYCILREISARLAVPLTVVFVLLPTGLLLSPERFESFVIATVLLGYWSHRRGRPSAAAFFWSIGCWLKWYPAFFIAAQELRALMVDNRPWQWLSATGIFVGVSLALNLPLILANLVVRGNIDNWIYAYQFHAGRGVSGDTILGVAQMWIGELSFSNYSTAWTLGLVIAALLIKPRLQVEYRCMLICISMLVLNRIYSTQFNLWFYPFIILAAAQETSERRRWLLVMLVGIDLLNVLVFPFSYVWTLQEVDGLAPLSAASGAGIGTVIFSTAVVLRGIMLVVLAVFALRGKKGDDAVAIDATDSPTIAGGPHRLDSLTLIRSER